MLDFMTHPATLIVAVGFLLVMIVLGSHWTGRWIGRAEEAEDYVRRTERVEAQNRELMEELRHERERKEAIVAANKAADAIDNLSPDELREPDAFERK